MGAGKKMNNTARYRGENGEDMMRGTEIEGANGRILKEYEAALKIKEGHFP